MLPCNTLVCGDWYAYAETAQQILDGGRLYEDVWQDKPPLGLLYYVPSQFFARGSTLGLYLFFAGWLLLEVAVVWLFTRDIENPACKWIASFLICLLPITEREFSWPGTVHVANLFVLINILVAYRFLRVREAAFSWCVAAGVTVVCAFHSRQSALTLASVPMLVAILIGPTMRARFRAIAGFALGALIGIAAVIALMLWVGNLSGYWDMTFLYPGRFFQYSEIRCAFPGESLAHIGWLLTSPPGVLILTPVFFVMTALMFANSGSDKRAPWLIVACSFLCLMAITSPRKPYPQYLSAAMPVLSVMPLVYLADRTNQVYSLKKWVSVGLLSFLGIRGVGAMVIVAIAPEVDSPNHVRQRNIAGVVSAAQYVDLHARPGDDLYASGDWISEPAFYFMTRTPPAHRYFWTMQLNPYWVYANPNPESIATYRLKPPAWLAILSDLPSNDREGLPFGHDLAEHYLNAYSYEEVAQIDKWKIHRRSN